jgi:UDP-N-acetylglucosamine--N-acetylmuramyl-(pentapeptide) pyrophosphoryl-undecaprenol N-acetylglucosamine transferase
MKSDARMNQGTVLIMAGGTGGHIFPALSIAEHLRERGYHIEWLGTRKGLEVEVLAGTGISLNFLNVTGLRGKGLPGMMLSPWMLLRSTWQALGLMQQIRPCVVLGMGGYVTGPGGLAARLSGRPLLIHEQNAIAGFSNRLLSRIAVRVMQAFPDTFNASDKVITTGNPVRREISALPARTPQTHTARLRVLVLGGSLGAVAINQALPVALSRFSAEERPVVVHQTGKRNIGETQHLYAAAGLQEGEDIQLQPFIADMAGAYRDADLVICRAGATTVCELAAAGVASVLIPYPHAVDDHQTANARWLSDADAAVLLPQSRLDADTLYQTMRELLTDTEQLSKMACNARALARPDATERVGAICMEMCNA